MRIGGGEDGGVMKPIIFSTEMVRALLDGRKTQTRRVIKPQPTTKTWEKYLQEEQPCYLNPYGQPGDVLWVRETWADLRGMGFGKEFAYRADSWCGDHEDSDSMRCRLDYGVKWKPSIHMPRKAARLFLEITDIKVERVQDIDDDDAIDEGVGGNINEGPTAAFAELWDTINAKRGYSWESNPWCWVIEFRRADD